MATNTFTKLLIPFNLIASGTMTLYDPNKPKVLSQVATAKLTAGSTLTRLEGLLRNSKYTQKTTGTLLFDLEFKSNGDAEQVALVQALETWSGAATHYATIVTSPDVLEDTMEAQAGSAGAMKLSTDAQAVAFTYPVTPGYYIVTCQGAGVLRESVFNSSSTTFKCYGCMLVEVVGGAAYPVSISYGGRIISSAQETLPLVIAYNGQTIKTVSEVSSLSIATLFTAGKIAKTDITIGGTTLRCAGKVMTTDVGVFAAD